jgi:hypothetical protein
VRFVASVVFVMAAQRPSAKRVASSRRRANPSAVQRNRAYKQNGGSLDSHRRWNSHARPVSVLVALLIFGEQV